MKKSKKCLSQITCLAPGFIIYAGIMIVPALYTIFLSFFQWNGVASVKKEFVGLDNYSFLLTNVSFYQALLHNLLWIAMTLIVTTTVSFCFALLLNKPFKGRTFFRGLFYFPYITSGVAIGIVWSWVYQPQFGLLKSLGELLGLEFLQTAFLAQSNTALIAVYIAALYQGFGHPMTLFLSGLQSVPSEQLEAAAIDGANSLQRLFHVTIPMMKETFVIVFSTQFINGLLVYDLIIALAGNGLGRPTTVLSVLMMNYSFKSTELGKGAATAVLMLLFLLGVIIPYMQTMAREER